MIALAIIIRIVRQKDKAIRRASNMLAGMRLAMFRSRLLEANPGICILRAPRLGMGQEKRAWHYELGSELPVPQVDIKWILSVEQRAGACEPCAATDEGMEKNGGRL
jgi:hypothetical protein